MKGVLVVLALLGVSSISVERSVAGQSTNPIVSSRIGTDSIQVGAVFTLELHVELPIAGQITFPAVLPLPESIEQREAVEISTRNDGTVWSAVYVLTSWTVDSLAIPPIIASVVPEAGTEFDITIDAPREAVHSVLPADGSDLALRDARPFLRVRGFPWWLLGLLALALAVAFWLWRKRTPAPELAPTGPWHRALHEFDGLRAEWSSGGMSVGQFYDRYEGTLRRYARSTRRWAPYQTMVGLVRSGDLFAVLRRSLIVRFAHARDRSGGPEAALDAGVAFVRSEMPAEDDDDESPPGPKPGNRGRE